MLCLLSKKDYHALPRTKKQKGLLGHWDWHWYWLMRQFHGRFLLIFACIFCSIGHKQGDLVPKW